jgi:Holliday junction DNA helicase RuvA
VIASLTGTVLSASNGQIVLDVQGVGYLVNTTVDSVEALSAGQTLTVFTSLVVREDSMTLFGFITKSELEVFELLRSVNGVGPKSALAILGELSVERIAQAVANEQDATFKAVSGIGAKTAKLITLTLSGKLSMSSNGSDSSHSEKAVNALMSLGWNEKLSRETVHQVGTADMTDKQLLKAALQVLSKAKSR